MRLVLFEAFHIAALLICCHASVSSGKFKRTWAVDRGLRTSALVAFGGAKLTVVAAHHDEDLKWLDEFAQACNDCKVFVYTSSQKRARRTFHHGPIRQVPNVGREWGKYLRFIIDEWHTLQEADTTVLFIHAHSEGKGVDDADREDLRKLLPRWPAEAANRTLFLHGTETAISMGDTTPVDYGASISKLWPTLFSELGNAPQTLSDDNSTFDLDSISGAEFSVPAYRIVHRPLKFYTRLEQWLMSGTPPVVGPCKHSDLLKVSFNYAAGTILELMAYQVFGEEVHTTLSDIVVSQNPLFAHAKRLIVVTTKKIRGAKWSSVRESQLPE
jgi:hypothetical protein